MAQALYRKYRSKSLNEVVGQDHVTDILSRAIKQGRIAHAYLLTGPRGVGKTSIARILAHEINGLPYDDDSSHLDIIEIDAASNNGVEDVRDLRDKIQTAPVSAAKKIYIIDEVHMLSKAAFNALLKTLEEPPAHAVFILATTDADKLPATIISRTQRFAFRAIGVDDAIKHMKMIAEKEGIAIDNDALRLIAERGDGSFRDSISLLDQLASLTDDKDTITASLVETALGLAPHDVVNSLIKAVTDHQPKEVIALLDRAEHDGVQMTVLTHQLISTIRAKIGDAPQLIDLLDQLLDVGKSRHPNIKILTCLLRYATPKQPSHTAALSVTLPSVSATIPELQQQASRPIPQAPVAKTAKTTKPSAPATTTEPPVMPTRQPGTDYALDWAKVVDYTKQHYVAIHSVLSKCSFELDDTTLTIFTVNNFYKKKLDDSKYRIMIIKALEETGAGDLLVVTIGTPPPPKDSTAAAVAAIMGGGEEVSI